MNAYDTNYSEVTFWKRYSGKWIIEIEIDTKRIISVHQLVRHRACIYV